MIPPRFRSLIGVLLLLASGWVCLVAFEPNGYVTVGYMFGTLFGQTTLAAAWAVFGPLRWYLRLPLAMLWLLVLWFALAVMLVLHAGPDEILPLIGVCLLGQWILVQLPLWGLALGYGLRVRHRPAEQGSIGTSQQLQFGIRQLMTLTAVIALVLGVSRAVLLLVAERMGDSKDGAMFFIFLAVAAAIMTLPLLIAALLPRWAVAATLAVLMLIGLATAGELAIMRLLPPIPGPDVWHFAFINAFTAAWILAPIGIMRLGGYGLTSSAAEDAIGK